jgi:RNA polymerase sigma factor (sigma-70 family)
MKNISAENINIKTLKDKHGLYIRHIVGRYVSEKRNIEDVEADVWEKIFKAIDRYDAGKSFTAWAGAITRNQCIDYLRKKNKTDQLFVNNEYASSYEHHASEEESKENDLLLLKTGLEQLEDMDRLIIVLKHIDGLSVEAIRKRLNLSESAVKVRLYRAREKLKEILQT